MNAACPIKRHRVRYMPALFPVFQITTLFQQWFITSKSKVKNSKVFADNNQATLVTVSCRHAHDVTASRWTVKTTHVALCTLFPRSAYFSLWTPNDYRTVKTKIMKASDIKYLYVCLSICICARARLCVWDHMYWCACTRARACLGLESCVWWGLGIVMTIRWTHWKTCVR